MALTRDRKPRRPVLPVHGDRTLPMPAGSARDAPDRHALQVPTDTGIAALDAARGYAQDALSPATLRAYEADWAHYQAWCRDAGWAPLPAAPASVAAYLSSMAPTHSRATIRRRLVAIGQRHKLAGKAWVSAHPLIRATLRGTACRPGRRPRSARPRSSGSSRPATPG